MSNVTFLSSKTDAKPEVPTSCYHYGRFGLRLTGNRFGYTMRLRPKLASNMSYHCVSRQKLTGKTFNLATNPRLKTEVVADCVL